MCQVGVRYYGLSTSSKTRLLLTAVKNTFDKPTTDPAEAREQISLSSLRTSNFAAGIQSAA